MTTWYSKNREISIQRAKQWALDHPEEVKARYQKKKNNPEFKKAKALYFKEWSAKNKDKVCVHAAKRRKRHKQATPKVITEWDQLFFDEIYDIAKKRGLTVDHIVPLTHPLVCGLHAPANLQLLSWEQKMSKGNRFNVDG